MHKLPNPGAMLPDNSAHAQDILSLPHRDRLAIAQALLNPPVPSPALVQTFRRHREFVKPG